MNQLSTCIQTGFVITPNQLEQFDFELEVWEKATDTIYYQTYNEFGFKYLIQLATKNNNRLENFCLYSLTRKDYRDLVKQLDFVTFDRFLNESVTKYQSIY